MKVKIKRLSDKAVIPQYAKDGDAGLDLVATNLNYCEETNSITYGTDLAIEIPNGYVGYLFARSSNSKKDLLPSNAVGVIDSGYRGEIKFNFKIGTNSAKIFLNTLCIATEMFELKSNFKDSNNKLTEKFEEYAINDRIGQLIIMPYPNIEFEEVEELSLTERGRGGYGSTGN